MSLKSVGIALSLLQLSKLLTKWTRAPPKPDRRDKRETYLANRASAPRRTGIGDVS